MLINTNFRRKIPPQKTNKSMKIMQMKMEMEKIKRERLKTRQILLLLINNNYLHNNRKYPRLRLKWPQRLMKENSNYSHHRLSHLSNRDSNYTRLQRLLPLRIIWKMGKKRKWWKLRKPFQHLTVNWVKGLEKSIIRRKERKRKFSVLTIKKI